MRRDQLEHLIRAAGAIVQSDDVVVIGSQAILGSYDEAVLPGEATFSVEADIVPLGDVDGRRADLIDGAIGEASMFHETYGIYAQGVGLSTAMLAPGWDERLVPLVDRSTGTTGWCLDVHDLCVAKLLAGRQKDRDFVAAIIGARLADPAEVARLLEVAVVATDRRATAQGVLAQLEASGLPERNRRSWWRRRTDSLADRLRLAPRPRPQVLPGDATGDGSS
ncbi:MAG: hypothetical protein IT196_11625 [Acidimicrobiales bacterium]|nr:hypothetical protein [Acidimicrobiales bacterium]